MARTERSARWAHQSTPEPSLRATTQRSKRCVMLKPARNRAITRPLNRTMPIQLPGVRCSSVAFPARLPCCLQDVWIIRSSRLTQALTEASSARETSATRSQGAVHTGHMLTLTPLVGMTPGQVGAFRHLPRPQAISRRWWSISLGCQIICPSIVNACGVHS